MTPAQDGAGPQAPRDGPGTHAGEDGPGTLARVVVPAGLGVLTWLLLAVVGATVLSGLSVQTVVTLFLLSVLFAPLVAVRPWEPAVTGRTLALAREHDRALAVAAGLFVLARLPVVADLLAPLLGLVRFPLRIVPQLLFDVRVYYGTRLGPAVGDALFAAASAYVELLWLFVVGVGVAKLFPADPDESYRDRPAGERS